MSEPTATLAKIFDRNMLKWSMNFGVGTVFAVVMLLAGIYFANRLANAQDTVASAVVEMKSLVAQAAVTDAEREARAQSHYRETIDMRAEIARRELTAIQREVDAIERSRKLAEVIQAMMEHAQGKPKAGG